MTKSYWLLSAAAMAFASPAFAQNETTQTPSETDTASEAPAEPQAGEEIVVTATRRVSRLADVPIAVTAVSGEALQNSGGTDIRALNQLTPSLLVSSTFSEAGAVARIRGIGTVGDNPGLESSVGTFIDGVYRNRSGVALTELGPVQRVEVLRGPQGTLFGRNTSAGLISVTTARPEFNMQGYGEAGYGNYNQWRLAAGVTGPMSEQIAYRLDGVWTKRDGFMKDVISGRDVNDRDRWLVRGKMLFEPSSDVSFMLIGDYSHRNEECCAAAYLTADEAVPGPNGVVIRPSSVAAMIRSLTSLVPGAGQGLVLDDTFDRKVAITPGRSFRSDVRDWGLSGELNWKFEGATLTSITAYRDWKLIGGVDADFNNLDILPRDDDGSRGQRFKTFTQELRLQGSAFDDRLDWLVGGYYAHEDLVVRENTAMGADYSQYARALVRTNGALIGNPLLAAFPGYELLSPFVGGAALTLLNTNPAFAAVPPIARPPIAAGIASQVQNVTLSGSAINDRFEQKSRNLALFTHNIVKVTDQLSFTIGARYTSEKKDLDADLVSTSPCAAYVANINRLNALAVAASVPGGPPVFPPLPASLNPAIAALSAAIAGPQGLRALTGLPCAINSVNGNFETDKKESEWSGTAVLSYKPTENLMAYLSYARGYKAGGFNLDRAPLFNTLTLQSFTDLDILKFDPEKVDAFEIGAKLDGRGWNLNVAAFYELFKSFQLNTFNGTNFFVTDIRGCKDDLGDTDQDLISGNSQCDETKGGVTSKGIEIEGMVRPHRDISLAGGFTYANTRYRSDLSGTPDFVTGNNSLQPALWLLPGSRLSNSAEVSATGSATWTPLVTGDLRGLFYLDFRYTSKINTGSDLFVEKTQGSVFLMNARLGLGRDDERWRVELWAQNLLDKDYKQIAFSMPLQGSNTSRAETYAFGTPSTQLFGAFLAEPRTYGITLRGRF